MATFVLNDESKKNSHGFYLLNAGGRFDRFKENPVMLDAHDMSRLMGKWLNLKIDGVLLTAEPEFDEGDPEAMKVKGKVDRGYLKGASVGIIILSAQWRENPLTHEEEIYVTDWELFEASTVAVPSNAGALTLKVYDGYHRLVSDENIRLHLENIIRLSVKGQSINSKNRMQMNEKNEIKLTAEALVALGMKEDADGGAISAAIVALKREADKNAADLSAEKQKNETATKKQAEELVNLAIKEGKITADTKESFIKLALADFETTRATLTAIPGKQSLAAQVQSITGGDSLPKERDSWTLLQWMKEDMTGLNKLKTESPDVYEKIKNKK
jgi:HK97 family phage prohead protease